MPPPPTPASQGQAPTRILALFYAAKFGHLGIVLPFLAPWVQSRGFGSLAIGALLALPPLFKMLAPWSWGLWADRSGKRKQLLVMAIGLAAISLGGLAAAPGLAAISLLMTLYAFTRAPILPYIEATTLEQSERGRFDYGPIRLWGSVAFMASSFGYGALSERLPADAGVLAAAALLGAGGLIALALPGPAVWDQPSGAHAAGGGQDAAAAWSRGRKVRFFVCCALMQFSHGAYYTFYSIHLQNVGYRGTTIGALWALAIVCEVLLLTRVDAVVRRFGRGTVLRTCLALAALRWLLIGGSTAPLSLVVAQTLHAATYAGFHVTAIRTVYEMFGREERARGQAMYSGMTFGLGLFAGSLVAGWLADPIGLSAVFRGSALVALAALLVAGRPRPRA